MISEFYQNWSRSGVFGGL